MAEIYLRGSLANQTMKNLTRDEIQTVQNLTDMIINHPVMAPNRTEFTKQLSVTIAGDYADDRATADNEYQIAIWRGVVYLLYHKDYKFKCQACSANTYTTQNKRQMPIDYAQDICPNCRNVKITDPGDSEFSEGQFVHYDDLQIAILNVPAFIKLGSRVRAGKPPQSETPIMAMQGKNKVENPNIVFEDSSQLHKYFTEFLWNYFRQIIRENSIKHHHNKPTVDYGPADTMAVNEIISELTRHKIKHQYNTKTEPYDKKYHIYLETSATPVEFTASFAEILHRYSQHNIDISVTPTSILVKQSPTAQMISASIYKPVQVMIDSNQLSITSSNDESSALTIDDKVIDKRSGGSPVAAIESKEVIDAIYYGLPEDARNTMDLILARGQYWDKYEEDHGHKFQPSCAAKVLGTTSKQIKRHLESIKVNCLMHGIVGPVNKETD